MKIVTVILSMLARTLAAPTDLPAPICGDQPHDATKDMLASDCIGAAAMLITHTDAIVPYSDANGKFTYTMTAFYNSCEVRVLYGHHWDGTCTIKFPEVGAAVSKLMGWCDYQDSNGEFVPRRSDMALMVSPVNCESTVRVVRRGT